jgi:hypothetical protein
VNVDEAVAALFQLAVRKRGGYERDEAINSVLTLILLLGYYFDHQEEIDQEITLEWQQVQENMTNQAAKSPFYVRMKAKGLL